MSVPFWQFIASFTCLPQVIVSEFCFQNKGSILIFLYPNNDIFVVNTFLVFVVTYLLSVGKAEYQNGMCVCMCVKREIFSFLLHTFSQQSTLVCIIARSQEFYQVSPMGSRNPHCDRVDYQEVVSPVEFSLYPRTPKWDEGSPNDGLSSCNMSHHYSKFSLNVILSSYFSFYFSCDFTNLATFYSMTFVPDTETHFNASKLKVLILQF